MRIAFDAKRAFLNHSGLGNYARTLLKNLLKQQTGDEYFLLSPKAEQNANSGFLFNQSHAHIKEGLSRLNPSPAWFKEQEITIYHGLSNELPLNAAKLPLRKIVTIHDVIFLRYPQWYSFWDRQIYTWKTKKACEQADTIIAVSQHTKNDLVELLKVPEQKIHVVYQSCDEVYTQPINNNVLDEVRQQYQLPPQYLLYVGTIEPRKNLLSICKALKMLKGRVDIPLVCVGRSTVYKKQVLQYLHNHGLDNRILFLENVPLEHMPAIYKQASLFIYPSTYEGFGIPIIEALYCEVPVITSSGSCFSEAGGPGSIYISSEMPMQLAESIERVINDKQLGNQMTRQGLSHAQQFNAHATASALLDLYNR